jgi:hypothetical protein
MTAIPSLLRWPARASRPSSVRRRPAPSRRLARGALAALAALLALAAPVAAQVELPQDGAAAPATAKKKKPARAPRPAPAPPADASKPAGEAPAAEPGDEAGKVDAKALVQSGVKLLKQKDYRGALAVFRDAYQRFPSVKLLLNIGTTLKLLGRNAEAANAYQRYLDDPEADPARISEVGDVLATLDRVLGRLQLEVGADAAAAGAPVGTGAADVEIVVNGGEPLPPGQVRLVRVDPGEYRVAVRRPGFVPAERTGQVGAGELVEVKLTLVALPEEPAPPRGGAAEPLPGATAGGLTSGVELAPSRRSRLGLMLRGHFHISPAGAAALVGPTVDLTDRIEVHAGALLGRFRGGYLGGSFAVLPGRFRPLAAAGLLIVADDGPRFAARGAVGLEVVVSRNLSVFAELGGEHLFNPPMTVFANAFVPSAGVFGRL